MGTGVLSVAGVSGVGVSVVGDSGVGVSIGGC